jgi:hypothetical protein
MLSGEANSENYTARVWLTILQPQLPRIEARLVQWVAQGRVRIRESLGQAASADQTTVLRQAVADAAKVLKDATARLAEAEAERQAAEAALKEQMGETSSGKGGKAGKAATGKKGKKAPVEDPALRAALDAGEAVVQELRVPVENAQLDPTRTEQALQQYFAEASLRKEQARLNAAAEAAFVLRAEAYQKRTGRHMACDVPHMIEGARKRVRERPEELILTVETLRGVLAESGIPFDVSSARPIFEELNRQERSRGELPSRPTSAIPALGSLRSRPTTAPAVPMVGLRGGGLPQLAQGGPAICAVTGSRGLSSMGSRGLSSMASPGFGNSTLLTLAPREATPPLRPISLVALRKGCAAAARQTELMGAEGELTRSRFASRPSTAAVIAAGRFGTV